MPPMKKFKQGTLTSWNTGTYRPACPPSSNSEMTIPDEANSGILMSKPSTTQLPLEPSFPNIMECPQSSSTSQQAQSSVSTSQYKGQPLKLEKLSKKYSFLKTYKYADRGPNQRKRQFVQCLTCANNETVAVKYSRNGKCAMASGVRVDSEEKIKQIIDHLESSAHQAATEHENLASQYDSQSDKHPWLSVLKKHRTEVIDFLIQLAMDVYNDSLLQTVSAYSWPTRSLTQLAAAAVSRDMDSEFTPFQPQATMLHYRDPMIYREMLGIIGKHVRDETISSLNNCIAFAIQIDGSADRQMLDNKFCSCRYVTGPPDFELKTILLDVSEPEADGAMGLLEATLSALENVDTAKLFGVTTDGESANTGKDSGLWKLLSDKMNKSLLTMWCVAHRSDLAMESMLATVPELKIWLAKLKALNNYFRMSSKRTKALHQIYPAAREFPGYLEVRFVEHLHQLIATSLHNLPGCRMVWRNIADATSRRNNTQKREAIGFLEIWEPTSTQVWLTGMMGDITVIYATLQKKLQRGTLILPDVITCRDQALRKLQLMRTDPFPGGLESRILDDAQTAKGDNNSDLELSDSPRCTTNSLVNTFRRSTTAIRIETVMAAINFLEERLAVEQEMVIKAMTGILKASTAESLIAEAKPLVQALFPDRLAEFVESVCDSWDTVNEIPHLPPDAEIGSCLSTRLRKMIPCSQGLLLTMLAAIEALTPHSMQTERCVSIYNNIRSATRLSMGPDTANHHLQIAVNGSGTALFDPRPAVADFLKTKERRYREPDVNIYADREFARKFFRKDSSL